MLFGKFNTIDLHQEGAPQTSKEPSARIDLSQRDDATYPKKPLRGDMVETDVFAMLGNKTTGHTILGDFDRVIIGTGVALIR